MLITTLTYGGAETQVVRLAIELKAEKWDVAVACMIAPSSHTEILKRHEIPVYSLGMSRGVPDPRAMFRLASLIREFEPDVVHAHMVHANLLGRFTRLICRIRVLICTAHNLRETSEKGGPTWHKELLYRLTDSLSERTTIICNAAYERYIATKAVPVRKLMMIPNGVDIDKFAPSDEIRESVRKELNLGGNFAWLAVGRLVEQKDYPNLFAAVAQLPKAGWRVLIAGNGPLSSALKEQVASMGLAEHVLFIGTSDNMENLYKACDGFVMSSMFEGLSMALLEAAATGLAAVVTDVGGNRDLVTDGKTGFIVPAHNSEQLANGMARLMDMPRAERIAFGAAARQHCIEQYRFGAVAGQWLRLYRRLMLVRPKAQVLPTVRDEPAVAED